MAGLEGGEACERACNSGVFEMMADARLGAVADLSGGDITGGVALLKSIDCLGLGATGAEAGEGFTRNASSANLSATL